MATQEMVDQVVGRRREGEGFSYVSRVSEFTCQGRKGMVEHLRTEHPDTWARLGGEQAGLAKLISSAAFLEETAKPAKGQNGVAHKANGVAKAKSAVEVAEEVEDGKRKDYPVTLDTLRMIDARTVRIPDYGSLVGRIARMVAVVVGRREAEGEGEACLHCFKCSTDVAAVMEHLEEQHKDLLAHLATIFPPAKKRLAQFVEKAVAKFELKVETAKEVEQLVRAREKEEFEARQKALKEEREQRVKEARERREREEKEREAARLKRKLEWEQQKKEVEEKRKKIVPKSEEERLREERNRVKAQLSKPGGGLVWRKRLQKRLDEVSEKLLKITKHKRKELLDKTTKAVLEKVSPKQLRKLCMHYFALLGGEEVPSWREAMEAARMEVDLPFLAHFLTLLYDHARIGFRKSFKFGHMLVTSNQAELIFERGVRSVVDQKLVVEATWRLPSSWDVPAPSEALGEGWNRKDDSTLIIGTARCGKNITKILDIFPLLKTKKLVLDEEGKVKEVVKQRYAYLLNVYQNRGVYSEEFGESFYTGDVDEEVEAIDEEVIEVTKDNEEGVVKIEVDSNEETGQKETQQDSTEETEKKETPKDEGEEKQLDEKEVDALLALTPEEASKGDITEEDM